MARRRGSLHEALIAGGIVLLIALGVGAWYATRDNKQIEGQGSVPATAPESAATQAAPPLPGSQVDLFEKALASEDTSTVAQVLAPTVRSAYESHPFRLLPNGATIAVAPESFASDGQGATVAATVSDASSSQKWLLHLQVVDDQWLIYGTEKA